MTQQSYLRGKIKFVIFIIIIAYLIAYLISIYLSFPFFEDILETVASLSRALCVIFIFVIAKKLYDIFYDLCSYYKTPTKIFRILEFYFNNPRIHLLSWIIFNIVYHIIIVFYVLPILKWKPAHILLNSVWVGSIGIAFCFSLGSIIVVRELVNLLQSVDIFDPSHPDGVGGFRKLIKEAIKGFSFTFIGFGFIISSVPYSVYYEQIFIMMLIALSYLLFVDIITLKYIFNILSSSKYKLLTKLKLELDEIERKIELDSLEVLDKFVLKLEKLEKELYFQKVQSIREFPITFTDIINFVSALLGIIPILVRFLFNF